MLIACVFLGLMVWHWTAIWSTLAWGNTTSLTPSFPQLPIVPHVGLRPHELFHDHMILITADIS